MHRGRPSFLGILRPFLGSLRPWIGCLAAVMSILSWCAAARAEPAKGARIALVIGNAAYAAGPSPTSLNDAGLVARALSQAGFAVTAAGDVDHGRLEATFDGFLAEAANAGPEATILVYLAGYGLQDSGSVYFVPVGAVVARDTDIPSEAMSVTAFMQRLEALPAKARVFVYDLARETPFTAAGLSVASGLPLFQPSPGTIVAINAAPGTVAIPDVAPYGIYARALSEVIATSNLSISTAFERVRLRIAMLSNGANVPWNGGSIDGDVSLGVAAAASPPTRRPGGAESAGASPADVAYGAALARDTLDGYAAFLAAYPDSPTASRVRTLMASRREALLWNETLRIDTDRAYWTYMRRYRRGPHFADARRRLAMLQAALEPPPRFDILPYASAALPQPWEAALIDGPVTVLDDRAWPPPPIVDGGLPAADPAFYEDLPPPPLAPAGAVPIANPIGHGESGSIVQPDVPSIGSIVCETRFDADGSWIASSLVDGKALFTTRSSRGSHGDPTILQTGSDGMVFSRTVLTRDKGTMTILQTGPDGGILTKALTRWDSAGGRSTLLTNGNNQIVATSIVDNQGLTTIKRGQAPPRDQILALGVTNTGKPSAALASPAASPPPAVREPLPFPEPQPPPPLAMPASMLPAPIPAPAPPAPPPITAPPIVAPKIVTPKIVTRPPIPSVSIGAGSEPLTRSATELPKIAPLPPRRAMSIKAPFRPKSPTARALVPASRRGVPAAVGKVARGPARRKR